MAKNGRAVVHSSAIGSCWIPSAVYRSTCQSHKGTAVDLFAKQIMKTPLEDKHTTTCMC